MHESGFNPESYEAKLCNQTKRWLPGKKEDVRPTDLSATEHIGKLLTEEKESTHPMRLFFLLLYNLLLIPHTMI